MIINTLFTGRFKILAASAVTLFAGKLPSFLVARLGPYDHVTATLKDRYWLPIEQRILSSYVC